MSDGRKYFCYCDSNCKFETMTKEQILAAIAQAVETGSVGDCDTGFITKVKEQNAGGSVTFWVGTQAQYNALDNKATNCMYIITDDTATADMKAAFEAAAAAAKESAESAAESAAAAIAAAESAATNNAKLGYEDLTDKIVLSFTHSFGGGGLNVTNLTTKKYYFRYYPTLNIMVYSFTIYITGKMAKGEQLHFLQSNGPTREVTGAQTILQTSRRNSTGENCDCRYVNYTDSAGNYVGCGVLINANNAVDTGGEQHPILCQGWHYVEPTK